MAMLAHVLQIVGFWIAPLIVFLIKRESRFVSFHALQALFLQIAYMFLLVAFGITWFSGFFLLIANAPAAKGGPPPAGFFVLMPLIFVGWMSLWAFVLVCAIVYGIKASRGEWAEYPILGRFARNLLKIGPGGTSLP